MADLIRGASPISRRKPKTITLTMLAGTAIVLTGCLDDDKPKLVKDESECSQQLNDQEGCHNAAIQARQDFEKTAPRYDSQKDCEAQFGQERCHKVERDGSSWFMPAMAGFMIGRMLDGGGSYRVQPTCRNGEEVYANGCGPIRAGGSAVYNASTSSFAGRYAGGSYRPAPSYSESWTSGKVAASRASMGATAVARGGFGGSAVGMAGA